MSDLILMTPFFAAKLSEKDSKVLIALLIVILLVVMIFGFLQKLVAKVMYYQGLRIDTMMVDIIRTGVIKDTDKKTFRKVATRKSKMLFLKQSWIPFTILLACALAIVLYAAFTKDMGFTFFTTALKDMSLELSWPTEKFFGLTLISDWPTVVKEMDFSPSLPKYYTLVVLIIALVAMVFFLVDCQALCARSMRIVQLERVRFSKDLTKPGNSVTGNVQSEPNPANQNLPK